MRGIPPIERTPDQPGPGHTPPDLLRALDLTVARRVQGLLPGEHRAPGTGEGTELAQVRPYQPGDDVRRIDWNVTARTREPHVRVQVPERALTTWLVLDGSPSMNFGTADRRKIDVAEGVAIALGHVATRRGNRLGSITFGPASGPALRPRSGRTGLLATLRAARREPARDGEAVSGLDDALRRVGRLARTRGVIVVVSDFRGPHDWYRPLTALRGRHGVLCVEIRDPREEELPAVGPLWLVDPETGGQMRVDTGRPAIRERFREQAARERAELRGNLHRAGAQHVVLSTEGDWLRRLATSLRGVGVG